MQRQIPIQALARGMFVVADVRSEVVHGQTRYFLVARDAAYAAGYGNRRARLARNRHEQVARAGGMLITEEHHITALRAAGLSAVTIDTDMGDDAPDLPVFASGAGAAKGGGAMDAADYEILGTDQMANSRCG